MVLRAQGWGWGVGEGKIGVRGRRGLRNKFEKEYWESILAWRKIEVERDGTKSLVQTNS